MQNRQISGWNSVVVVIVVVAVVLAVVLVVDIVVVGWAVCVGIVILDCDECSLVFELSSLEDFVAARSIVPLVIAAVVAAVAVVAVPAPTMLLM